MRLAPALLALWLLGQAAPVSAATYDPDLTWRTLVTEHFRIHFHQGEEQLAEEFSQMVERVYTEMSAEMKWRMRMRADVVLIDQTDVANGFARAVPYNAITIFVTAPQEDATLSLYEDWSELIFTHELTHVLHLETHGGIVGVARAVIGRIASTNDVSPPWIVEGLATFQETRHSATGRGRSPFVDMIKRTAVVEDAWPPLGNLDGVQAAFPSGNLRYLFGQDFIQWVSDHKGEDVWTRWTHAYGRSVPYALFLLPPKRVFGERFQGMYADWRDERHAEYSKQISDLETVGVREGRLISVDTSSCTAPTFAPDDSAMIWSCYDLRTGNALWIAEADGSGARKLKQDIGAKNFTWRADSKAFVYATTHIVNRFNSWSDIYLFDLSSKSVRSLTRGARARDPDFSPDGSHLMMVTNRAQDTQLEVLTVDQRRVALTDHADHTQYSTPRYAPNGRVVAVSIWEHGRRDMWLVDTRGQRLRRLTADSANDREPAWSEDGTLLYFTSERTGIPNIFAIDLLTERLWQVTNVRTGASKPDVSTDGTRLAYQQYSQDGWEIRLMDIDRSTWIDHGLLPAPLTGGPALASLVTADPTRMALAVDVAEAWVGEPVRPGALRPQPDMAVALAPAQDTPQQDGSIPGTFEQTEVDDVFGDEKDYPFTIKPRRYNPAPAMVPRYWAPGFASTPLLPDPPANPVNDAFASLPWLGIGGFSFQASTGTSDPVQRYAYSAFLSYRTDAQDLTSPIAGGEAGLGGGASFTINRWLPVFSFGGASVPVPYTYQVLSPWQVVTEGGRPTGFVSTIFTRESTGFFSLTYPFTPRSTFFANYVFTHRTFSDVLNPNADPASVVLTGTVGDLTAGYRYSWGQPTATAVSPEDARTLVVSARVTAPWLGTFALDDQGGSEGVTQVLLSVDWREFLVNPAAPNHVFALRGGAGVAFGGERRFLGNFQLGGNGIGAARAIRGYAFGADRGDSYWLLGAEYRFPIWRMDRGFGTVPVFFRYLAGTVYAEAGNAFDGLTSFVDLFDDSLVGIGAELRLSTFILWSGTLDLRLGYGVGLTPGGFFFDDPRSVYFLLSTDL